MSNVLENFDPELIKQWAENMRIAIRESTWTVQEFAEFLYSDEGKKFVDNIMVAYLTIKYDIAFKDSQNLLNLIKESINDEQKKQGGDIMFDELWTVLNRSIEKSGRSIHLVLWFRHKAIGPSRPRLLPISNENPLEIEIEPVTFESGDIMEEGIKLLPGKSYFLALLLARDRLEKEIKAIELERDIELIKKSGKRIKINPEILESDNQ